ncbi:phosphate acyltransferase PlsX [Oceanisphaera psychrotolerans]|uniref:Phosphate acyltransferase n=1 Tax=Oceanisphaera psychrotolerans TaxID=1414654 RepID=A0A1J4QA30_9GAMM|nr:phosphate acyltransferase PlsX [Oceanisphaera psychrotolerans]OIN04358.1 phosphate acyltransferase [Oceanisphaera psychrotolerans]
MSQLTVALDMMGGDYGPPVTVPAAVQALSLLPELNLVLFGSQTELSPWLRRFRLASHTRVRVQFCSQQVGNEHKAAYALRHLTDSSMRRALDALASGQARACVSAGNTGALMAMAMKTLSTLPGVDRPALITRLPQTGGGHALLLDVGANLNCGAEQLVQFALMGEQAARHILNISHPRIALLNVGAEANKGNEAVREAGLRLQQVDALHYSGYIEGDDLFSGQADVVVCDGFVGNVALKTSEGVARLLLGQRQQRGFLSKILTFWLKKRLSHLNPDQYNGASLIGLRASVVKSHGSAGSPAFLNAILQAVSEIEHDLPASIAHRFDTAPRDSHAR